MKTFVQFSESLVGGNNLLSFQILLRRVDNKLELFMERTNRQLQNLQELANAAIESNIVMSRLEDDLNNCRFAHEQANQKSTGMNSANVVKSAAAGKIEDEYKAAKDAQSQTENLILVVNDLCEKLDSQHNEICIAKIEELRALRKIKESEIEVLLRQI